MANVLDIAAIGMAAEMRQVETVAQNIANATTAGYKRRIGAGQSPFAATLAANAAAAGGSPSGTAALALPGAASGVAATSAMDVTAVIADPSASGAGGTALERTQAAPDLPDLTPGRLAQTGNPYHLALAGPGLFAVRRDGQVAYTRAGNFERTADGRLVNPQGWALQGDSGDLALRAAEVRFEADGTVTEEQRPVGRVAVFEFAQRTQLMRGPDGLFVGNGATPVRVDAPLLKPGHLEMANVDLGHETVQMMQAMRRFELGQRVVFAHEDMMERAIRRLGDLQA